MRTLSPGFTLSLLRGAIVKKAAVSLRHYIYAIIDLFFLFCLKQGCAKVI